MITNVVISICGSLLLLLLFEFTLRVYYRYRGKVYIWEPFQKMKFMLDRSALPQLSTVTNFKSNSFGELGNEPQSSECFRILIVGGSAVECYFLGTDNGFTTVLQESLSDSDLGRSGVHVGSIARSGIGADVLSSILEKVLNNYNRLDLILCMVGGNDLARWLGNSAPDSGEKLSINPIDFLSVNQQRTYSFKSLRSSAIFELLKSMKRYYVRQVIIKKSVGNRLHSLRSMRADASTIRTSTGDPSLFLKQYEKNLTAMLLECQKKAGRVIVIPQPWFEGDVSNEGGKQFWEGAQGQPFREKVETYFSLNVFSNMMKKVGISSKKVAGELGIEVIDLSGEIPADFDHFYDFTHFTNLGVKKVTSIIKLKILSGGSISDQSTKP